MKIGNEELSLQINRKKGVESRKAVLAEDILIPTRTKMVTAKTLDEDSKGMIRAVEPVSTTINSGILSERTLNYNHTTRLMKPANPTITDGT